MSIEALKLNIKREKELAKRLNTLLEKYSAARESEKKQFEDAITSTKKQIQILNNSTPDLVKNTSLIKKLSENEKQENKIIRVSHIAEEGGQLVAINKQDKKDYLKQLHISETSLKNLRKVKVRTEEFQNEFRKPNPYTKLANKIFSNSSNSFVRKGSFKKLKTTLMKGNLPILLNSYISIIFLTTLLSFFVSIFIVGFFMFFGLLIEVPFIYIMSYAEGTDIMMRFLKLSWLMIAIPVSTFLAIYFYPSLERSSLESEMDSELPFVTIQMAAIASADITPTNIFRIIAMNKEYPRVRDEAKKLMNQINLYGYDLVSALKNVAASNPSKKWADLLNGMSTTIRSGGNLSKFLSKRAETMLFEYRLKKERATKAAETFMDIYISIVIAAPMLLMLVLIMLNLSSIGTGLSTGMLTLIIVLVVVLINAVFLVVLHSNKNKF